MVEKAFVSFRLPGEKRDRLHRMAKEGGCTLQDYMQELVDERLAASSPDKRSLPGVLKRLRAQQSELTGRGVAHLWVFGSVARGEPRRDSDIDLIVELRDEPQISLTAFARLRLDLADLLQAPVDLAEWRTLPPRVAAQARHDAVAVF